MPLEGDPKNVKPFLKNSFLKDFRRRNCGGRCVRCASEFADVARFVEGPAILDHPLNATRRNADTISYCSDWKI